MSALATGCPADTPSVIYAMAGVQKTLVRYWKQLVVVNGVKTAGAPIDTTGYSARFVVAKPGTAGATAVAAIDLRSGTAALVLTPATGKIEVSISRAELMIAPGEYHATLILTSPTGSDRVLERKRFVVDVLGVPL
jgi:hypothetical protein